MSYGSTLQFMRTGHAESCGPTSQGGIAGQTVFFPYDERGVATPRRVSGQGPVRQRAAYAGTPPLKCFPIITPKGREMVCTRGYGDLSAPSVPAVRRTSRAASLRPASHPRPMPMPTPSRFSFAGAQARLKCFPIITPNGREMVCTRGYGDLSAGTPAVRRTSNRAKFTARMGTKPMPSRSSFAGAAGDLQCTDPNRTLRCYPQGGGKFRCVCVSVGTPYDLRDPWAERPKPVKMKAVPRPRIAARRAIAGAIAGGCGCAM